MPLWFRRSTTLFADRPSSSTHWYIWRTTTASAGKISKLPLPDLEADLGTYLNPYGGMQPRNCLRTSTLWRLPLRVRSAISSRSNSAKLPRIFTSKLWVGLCSPGSFLKMTRTPRCSRSRLITPKWVTSRAMRSTSLMRTASNNRREASSRSRSSCGLASSAPLQPSSL
jgi:hypothetical protein